jgi:acyl carrier protein
MTTEERWCEIEDIVIHFGVAKDLVYKWIESGDLPVHRVEGGFRFKLAEIDEWMYRNSKQNDNPEKKQTILSARLAIEQRVFQVLGKIAKWLPREQEVHPNNSLKQDLGFDSLALVHLQVAIEDEFGFRFDPVQTNFITVFDTAESLTTFLINAGVATEE